MIDKRTERNSSITQPGAVSPSDVGPNITGEIKMHAVSNAGLLYDDVPDIGAFFKSGRTNVVPNGANAVGAHLGFDASRVSKIYGSSSIVQPQSLMLLPCIKI